MPSETTALWMRRLPYAVIAGAVSLLLALLLPALQQAREAARRTQSKNNLKQFGLGLVNYHDTHQTFPPGGTFDEYGVAHHSWVTFLDPFLAASPFYFLVDFNVPWDDPKNVDVFLKVPPYASVLQNPSVVEVMSPDGFRLCHYTANGWIMSRNSSVKLQDLTTGTSSTAVAGEANGKYEPSGLPYNWRDITSGLGTTQAGFGCPTRRITMVLMADGVIRELVNETDATVAKHMAGPEELKPSPDQIAKPDELYHLPNRAYWRFELSSRGDTLMKLRLSPDHKYLKVDFGHYDKWTEADVKNWILSFQTITKDAAVEHVELNGSLLANELVPFLELPTLKRLTISTARIEGDKASVLATARREIEID